MEELALLLTVCGALGGLLGVAIALIFWQGDTARRTLENAVLAGTAGGFAGALIACLIYIGGTIAAGLSMRRMRRAALALLTGCAVALGGGYLLHEAGASQVWLALLGALITAPTVAVLVPELLVGREGSNQTPFRGQRLVGPIPGAPVGVLPPEPPEPQQPPKSSTPRFRPQPVLQPASYSWSRAWLLVVFSQIVLIAAAIYLVATGGLTHLGVILVTVVVAVGQFGLVVAALFETVLSIRRRRREHKEQQHDHGQG